MACVVIAALSGCETTTPRAETPWYEAIDQAYIDREGKRQDTISKAGGDSPEVERLEAAIMDPPFTREDAYRFLAITNSFDGTVVGFGGTNSLGSIAVAKLMHEPDAASVFRTLMRRAGTAGELYALCGLYVSDRDAFNAAIPPYLTSGDRVRGFLFGCVGSYTEVSGIAADIASGKWPRDFLRVPFEPEPETANAYE